MFKMFQIFVEPRPLKKPEKMYLPVTQKNINTGMK